MSRSMVKHFKKKLFCSNLYIVSININSLLHRVKVDSLTGQLLMTRFNIYQGTQLVSTMYTHYYVYSVCMICVYRDSETCRELDLPMLCVWAGEAIRLSMPGFNRRTYLHVLKLAGQTNCHSNHPCLRLYSSLQPQTASSCGHL